MLSDPEKREQYDQYGAYFGGNVPPGGGTAGPAGWPGGSAGPGGFTYTNVDLGDFGDLFGSMFGGGFGAARLQPRRPRSGAAT